MESHIESSISLVSQILRVLKTISTANIDINCLQLTECDNNDSQIVDENTFYTPKKTGLTIYSIIDDLNKETDIHCEINTNTTDSEKVTETFKFRLATSNNATFESADTKLIVGKIIAVREKSRRVDVVQNDMSEVRSFEYNIEQRDDLIVAQLNKTVLDIEYRLTYKIERGAEKEISGIVISIKTSTSNIQFDLI